MKSNEKISVLEEQLASTVSELNAVSVENTELRSQLNHIERISYSRKDELAHRSNSTERMEEGLIELINLLDERNKLFQNLENDFSKIFDEKQYCDSQVLLLREKLEMAQVVAEKSEAIAMDARQQFTLCSNDTGCSPKCNLLSLPNLILCVLTLCMLAIVCSLVHW